MTLFDANRLDTLPAKGLSVIGFRNQAAGFDPRSGEGARRFGRRFNSPHSFPVIYLCTSRPCVVAELTRQADRQGLTVEDLLPRELWRITAKLTKVLDLTRRGTLAALDLEPADLVRDDLRLTRAIGMAAQERGFQAIRSPSATGVDDIVAVMLDSVSGEALNTELIQEWKLASDLSDRRLT